MFFTMCIVTALFFRVAGRECLLKKVKLNTLHKKPLFCAVCLIICTAIGFYKGIVLNKLVLVKTGKG